MNQNQPTNDAIATRTHPHSALPWRYERSQDGRRWNVLTADGDAPIATVEQWADAEIICRGVNQHAALAQAVETVAFRVAHVNPKTQVGEMADTWAKLKLP